MYLIHKLLFKDILSSQNFALLSIKVLDRKLDLKNSG